MQIEQQYIDLYAQSQQIIFDHSADVMNAVRDEAFKHFKAQGFPTRKMERYNTPTFHRFSNPIMD